jgi:1,4-alpha-glucan branching enzyme
VRRILLQTAQSIADLPALRQGYGVLNPHAAVEAARRESHGVRNAAPRDPKTLRLAYHDDSAARVEVAGEFNEWDPLRGPLARDAAGSWVLELPLPEPGRYRYKLRIDGERWIADPENPVREPDPYGGLNSVLTIPSSRSR